MNDPSVPDEAPLSADPNAASPPAGPAPSAADRRQDGFAAKPPSPEPPERPFRKRTLIWSGLVVLAVAAVAALYAWLNTPEADPNSDLLVSAAATAPVFRVDVVTDDAEVAREYVIEQFGIAIQPPRFDDLQLLGVGLAELAPGVIVPAFRYDLRNDGTIVVYAYDYVMLDEAAASGAATLNPAVYARLAEPQPVDSRRVGDRYVVTWRDRAIIYTAIAPGRDSAELVLQGVRQ